MSSGTNELDIYRVKCEIERVALQSVVAPSAKVARDKSLSDTNLVIRVRHEEASSVLFQIQSDFEPYLEGYFGDAVSVAISQQAMRLSGREP